MDTLLKVYVSGYSVQIDIIVELENAVKSVTYVIHMIASKVTVFPVNNPRCTHWTQMATACRLLEVMLVVLLSLRLLALPGMSRTAMVMDVGKSVCTVVGIIVKENVSPVKTKLNTI